MVWVVWLCALGVPLIVAEPGKFVCAIGYFGLLCSLLMYLYFSFLFWVLVLLFNCLVVTWVLVFCFIWMLMVWFSVFVVDFCILLCVFAWVVMFMLFDMFVYLGCCRLVTLFAG